MLNKMILTLSLLTLSGNPFADTWQERFNKFLFNTFVPSATSPVGWPGQPSHQCLRLFFSPFHQHPSSMVGLARKVQ